MPWSGPGVKLNSSWLWKTVTMVSGDILEWDKGCLMFNLLFKKSNSTMEKNSYRADRFGCYLKLQPFFNSKGFHRKDQCIVFKSSFLRSLDWIGEAYFEGIPPGQLFIRYVTMNLN